MNKRLVKELQNIEAKAQSNFKEAQQENSHHGAGYFYIGSKIHALIGMINGYKKAPVENTNSLRELRDNIQKELEKYGKLQVSLQAEIDKDGELRYCGNLYGRLNTDHDFIYRDSYSAVFNKCIEKAKEDKEERDNIPKEDVNVNKKQPSKLCYNGRRI